MLRNLIWIFYLIIGINILSSCDKGEIEYRYDPRLNYYYINEYNDDLIMTVFYQGKISKIENIKGKDTLIYRNGWEVPFSTTYDGQSLTIWGDSVIIKFPNDSCVTYKKNGNNNREIGVFYNGNYDNIEEFEMFYKINKTFNFIYLIDSSDYKLAKECK